MQFDFLVLKKHHGVLNQELIELAVNRAPTGGNSKPFHWQWSGQTLKVQHDATLAEHYLNPNQHASWIALGCLIASARIAAQAQGWNVQAKVQNDLSADLIFSPSEKEAIDITTIKGLLSRRTYRGPFKPSAAPHLSQTSKKGVSVHLASEESISSEFKKYIIKTDAFLWLQKKAMMSFFGEVRFFDPVFDKRGIRSMDLGVGLMDQVLLYLFSFAPWVMSLIARVPGLNSNFVAASKRGLRNSHFLLVTAERLDPESLVQAGQEALKAWVDLEAQGYSAQPYSNASLTLVASETGNLHDDTLPQFRELFSSIGPSVMKEQFNLGPQEKPVWMLRVGQAPKAVS